MKKFRQLRIIAASLIALFLATAVSTNTFGNGDDTSASSISFHQKGSASHSTDHSFPFEEKEKEMEDRSETNPGTLSDFFVCLVSTIANPSVEGTSGGAYDAPRSCGDATNLPLFLAKRTILI